MGRPWFEVLVVFGVTLGELKVFAGESPDVVDVRPPAEGDDSVRPAPRSRGAAGWLGSPGAAVAGHPHPFNDVDVFGGPFGAGPQPRHMRAAITVGPRPRRRYARPTARPRSAAASRQHRLVADHDDAGIKRLGSMSSRVRLAVRWSNSCGPAERTAGCTAITYSSTRPGALASGPSVVGPHANKMSASPSSFFNAVSASARSPPITGRWSVAGQMREITTLRIPAPGRRRTHGTWD